MPPRRSTRDASLHTGLTSGTKQFDTGCTTRSNAASANISRFAMSPRTVVMASPCCFATTRITLELLRRVVENRDDCARGRQYRSLLSPTGREAQDILRLDIQPRARHRLRRRQDNLPAPVPRRFDHLRRYRYRPPIAPFGQRVPRDAIVLSMSISRPSGLRKKRLDFVVIVRRHFERVPVRIVEVDRIRLAMIDHGTHGDGPLTRVLEREIRQTPEELGKPSAAHAKRHAVKAPPST